MKSTAVWALVMLNALLLGVFLMQITRPTTAMADAAARPGEYIMLPGEVVGGNASVIYVVDQTNRQVSMLALNQAGHLEAMAPMDLARVFDLKNIHK